MTLPGVKAQANGGGRGIRTPGTVSRTAVFKTARFDRSRIPPALWEELITLRNSGAEPLAGLPGEIHCAYPTCVTGITAFPQYRR